MAKDLLKPIELLVIGGSAGSLDVIMSMLPHLKPGQLPAIVIVLHRKPGDEASPLISLLNAKGNVPVKEAEEKEQIAAGNIYVAPADYHLLIEKDRTLSLDYSEKVNYSRPAIDVTFFTAAEAYGASLAGIVLSGANDDGARGLKAIKEAGGSVAVQDPATADVGFMPQKALEMIGPEVLLLNKIMKIEDFINGLWA